MVRNEGDIRVVTARGHYTLLLLLRIFLVVLSPTRLCFKLYVCLRFIPNPLQLTHHSLVHLPLDATQTDILKAS